LSRELYFTRTFERLIKRLPKRVRDEAFEKLALYLDAPSHPSLRVKRIKGTEHIWEMSVTMNYRITFELEGDRVVLRRIGTHDVLRKP
jgi:mRNA-degrading endonuclease RelE of RelBE toxin-antitoxin system